MTSNQLLDIQAQTFQDIDDQAACLVGHDQLYRQLSCGAYRGAFSTVSMGGDVTVYFEQLNQLLDQWGSIPAEHVSAIFMMSQDVTCRLNGSAFTGNDVFLAGPGAEFHSLGKPGVHYCVVSVRKTYLAQLGLANDPMFAPHSVRNASFADRLRLLVRSACRIVGDERPTHISECVSGLNASIAETLAYGACWAHPSPDIAMSGSPFQTVRSVRSYIEENFDQDIQVAKICRYAGVSRRNLEYSFQTCLEQSPAAYLRSVRLNEIRRALKSPENATRTIGDIAAE
jgi:AraC family ethanolamine operon transcriptional activator